MSHGSEAERSQRRPEPGCIEHRAAVHPHQSTSQPRGGDFVWECWAGCCEESGNSWQHACAHETCATVKGRKDAALKTEMQEMLLPPFLYVFFSYYPVPFLISLDWAGIHLLHLLHLLHAPTTPAGYNLLFRLTPRDTGGDGDHNAGRDQRILTDMSGGIPMLSRAISASSHAVAAAAITPRSRSTHPFTAAIITWRPGEQALLHRRQTPLLLRDANLQHDTGDTRIRQQCIRTCGRSRMW
jgi:hypothetical protein